jgi:hypothetical protein
MGAGETVIVSAVRLDASPNLKLAGMGRAVWRSASLTIAP